jgi:hypothetical protein
MKSRMRWSLAIVLTATLTLAVRAQQVRNNQIQTINVERINVQPITVDGRQDAIAAEAGGGAGPVNLIGAIPVPAPIASTDITWVDQATGRFFLTDRTNKSVDVFDAVNGVYIASVPGFAGTPAPNGAGPNGVLVTPDNIMWVGDGNSMLQVVDLNVYPWRISHTIPVGGATDGRADELGYDPIERVIMIANDASNPPHVSFVSADTFQVLGQIKFPDATGLEQPVWDTQLHRFLVTVPSSPAYVAVIDPRRMRVTKKLTFPGCSGSVNGLALGPNQHILAVGCSVANILNAIDGRLINIITQVPGGDEVWFNAGDNRFYVTAADASGQTVLGVIDAQTGQWLQNVPANGVRNPSAFEGNNTILAPVRAPAAGTRDTTICPQFGLPPGLGCIAVFSHL